MHPYLRSFDVFADRFQIFANFPLCTPSFVSLRSIALRTLRIDPLLSDNGYCKGIRHIQISGSAYSSLLRTSRRKCFDRLLASSRRLPCRLPTASRSTSTRRISPTYRPRSWAPVCHQIRQSNQLTLFTEGTPFEGGAFRVKIVLGDDFPAAPPKG